jgi:hypothetical protein
MITEQQKENLKCGDKLIFIENGSVLSTNKGNVFTFHSWHDKEKEFFKCVELIDNSNHNLGISRTELFDINIHKEFKLMNKENLNNQVLEFNNKF